MNARSTIAAPIRRTVTPRFTLTETLYGQSTVTEGNVADILTALLPRLTDAERFKLIWDATYAGWDDRVSDALIPVTDALDAVCHDVDVRLGGVS